MGLTYVPTYLNTFAIELAQWCSDNLSTTKKSRLIANAEYR